MAAVTAPACGRVSAGGALRLIIPTPFPSLARARRRPPIRIDAAADVAEAASSPPPLATNHARGRQQQQHHQQREPPPPAPNAALATTADALLALAKGEAEDADDASALWLALVQETARLADGVEIGDASSRAALLSAAEALVLAGGRRHRGGRRRFALETPRASAKRVALALGRACVASDAAARDDETEVVEDAAAVAEASSSLPAPPTPAAPTQPQNPRQKPPQLARPPERPSRAPLPPAAAAKSPPSAPAPSAPKSSTPPPPAAARCVAAALRCAAAHNAFGEGPGGASAASRWAAGLLNSAALPGRDGLDLPTALTILRALRALGARGAPRAWLSAVFPTTEGESGAAGSGGGGGGTTTPAGLGLVYYSPEQAAEAVALLGRLARGAASRPPAGWARRALDKALLGGGGGGGGGGEGAAAAAAAAARLPTSLLTSLMAGAAALDVVPDPGQADALVEEVGRRVLATGEAEGRGGGGGGRPRQQKQQQRRAPFSAPTQAQLRDVQRALSAWAYRPSHPQGKWQWAAVREAGKAAAAGAVGERGGAGRGARAGGAAGGGAAAPSDDEEP